MSVSHDVELDVDGMVSLVAVKSVRPSESALLVALFTFPFSL